LWIELDGFDTGKSGGGDRVGVVVASASSNSSCLSSAFVALAGALGCKLPE